VRPPWSSITVSESARLVEALGWRHASLDRQASHILPTLFQERDKVVDGQHDVSDQLILSHINVSDSDSHAEDFLKLELDRRLDFRNLLGQIIGVTDRSREFASLTQTRTKETRDLLDERVGGDEGIIFARQLLDELFVLVEFLQVVGRHGIDAVMLRSIDVVLVTEDADGHVRARDARELDRARKTLVALRVIVLEADLQFDCLKEVALLCVVAVVQQLLHVPGENCQV